MRKQNIYDTAPIDRCTHTREVWGLTRKMKQEKNKTQKVTTYKENNVPLVTQEMKTQIINKQMNKQKKQETST